MMRWALILALVAPLTAAQFAMSPGNGQPGYSGPSIPVTFVNGTGISATNVALGTATGCATDTICYSLPLADLSTGHSVLANNTIFVGVMYATAGTAPTAKIGSSSMTALDVSAAESSRKLATFYLSGVSAGTPVLSISTSAVIIYDIIAVQFAGVSGLDGSVHATAGNSASNTLTGPSLTPLAGDLVGVIGCLAGTPARTSFTAGSGTNITFALPETDILHGCAFEWGTQGTSATYTPTLTTAGTASTYLVNAAAFTASTSTGTLPTGMYIASSMEVQKPSTATQVAAGNSGYQFPSTGNLIVLDQACGNFGISSIGDAGNSGKWVSTWPGLGINTNAALAYAPNAAADSTGTITVTYQSPGGSNGDCDGFFYDVHGAATVPNANRMQIFGNQVSAGSPLTYFSGFIPGASSGLIFADSSNVGDTVSSVTAPANSVFMPATFGGQSNDGPSLPGQNNLLAISPFSSNSSLSLTGTFSGSDAAGGYLSEMVAFSAPGATLGIFGNQYKNSPTVATGALSATLTPRTSSGVIWAFVAWDDTTHTMSCADTTNGTYNSIDSPVGITIGGTAMRFQTFWVANTTTSSITPKCTVSSGGSITTGTAWLAVHEIIGVSTLDTHPAVKGGTATGTNGLCNATGTLAAANEYIASAIVVGSTEESASTTFSSQQAYNAGAKGDASGDLVVGATTSQTFTWTLSTSGDTYACAVDSFQ